MFQQELEKYSQDKSHSKEHSNHDCETLRNILEMQLEDTMCKLIRTNEDMFTFSEQKIKNNKNNSIEEYMHYHKTSLENITKLKDEEIEKLKYVYIVLTATKIIMFFISLSVFMYLIFIYRQNINVNNFKIINHIL